MKKFDTNINRSLIAEIESQYHLSELKPFSNLSYNYVLQGYMEDTRIALKLAIGEASLAQELLALKAFEGYGGPKIIAASSNMILMECAIPGTSLVSYFLDREEEAVEIVCNMMGKLHKAPIPNALQEISVLLSYLQRKEDRIPTNYLQNARKIFETLIATSGEKVLLHGDLHHDNILRNGGDWIVIDPKGFVGEREYDVAAFIRNPMNKLLDHQKPYAIIDNRIGLFAKILDVDPDRIYKWYFVQLVLSWIWALEDGAYNDAKYFEKLLFEL
jgi:streptomycin 6-kinase